MKKKAKAIMTIQKNILIFITILHSLIGGNNSSIVTAFQITGVPSSSNTNNNNINHNNGNQRRRMSMQQHYTQPPVRQQMTSSSSSESEMMIEPSISPTAIATVADDIVQSEGESVVATENGTNDNNNSERYMVQRLRQEIMDIGQRTQRGFQASRSDRERIQKLIIELSSYNQVRDPVRMYYGNSNHKDDDDDDDNTPSIRGKWTLIYTDAPDITSLGTSSPLVTLGRIGQDCSNAPYIANVIEWCAPNWANNVPFLVGNQRLNTNKATRILQKVITFGSAVPSNPMVVDLNVAGFQLATGPTIISEQSVSIQEGNNNNNLRTAIEEDGIIVGLLKQVQQQQQRNNNNQQKQYIDVLKLDESRQPPFGSFEILYLDESLRITKTNRNHYTINTRITPEEEEEWF